MAISNSLRFFLERVFAKAVFTRYLPRASGKVPLVVSGRAGLRYVFRSMRNVDPVLISLVDEFVREGSIVWDVGANVGLMTFSAAEKAGRTGFVLAFEADIEMQRLLLRSRAKQGRRSAPVQVIPVAISSSVDLKEFCIAARSASANHLKGAGTTQTGGVANVTNVMAISLDWVSEHRPLPTVLKIDVEGSELEVLQGARNLLKKCRPIILCEVAGENSESVFNLLASHGYKIYDGEVPRAQRVEIQNAPFSTVAVPR